MITRLLFVAMFFVANAYSQTMTKMLGIDFNDYPVGAIYNFNKGDKNDLLTQVVSEKISLKSSHEKLEGMIGPQDQLFFIVARPVKNGPVAIQTIYTRRDKSGARKAQDWHLIWVDGVDAADLEITRLVEGVKNAIKSPSEPPKIFVPSKSVAHNKAQPREGSALFTYKKKPPTNFKSEEEIPEI